MSYPIRTNFVSIQLTPDPTPLGVPMFRATVVLENIAGPIPEQISLTVLVPAGDRSLVAIQNDAISRAALILAGATGSGHPSPSTALETWAKLAEM
jgi:hypothetical protein